MIIPHEIFENPCFYQKDRDKKGKKHSKIREVKLKRKRYDGVGETPGGKEKKTRNDDDPGTACPFHD
jgi:hypothetical protein